MDQGLVYGLSLGVCIGCPEERVYHMVFLHMMLRDYDTEVFKLLVRT